MEFHKATRSSTQGSCVLVAYDENLNQYLVKDSKNPEGCALAFTADEWEAFLDGVGQGEFTEAALRAAGRGESAE